MSTSPVSAIVGRLVRGLPPTDGTSDEALLARFVGWRDEAVFELLVYRHGPMVRQVCRRVLRHEQDAEDAFQATFLALAKRAGSIRGHCLAGWLYRVAFHAALKAKAKRVPCPQLWVGMGCSEDMPTQSCGHGTPEAAAEAGELSAVLDEEILRLPERLRLPVVLCYLQGRSNSEAAVALGIPKGTVDSRLSTARQRLRVRLLRRGMAPAVAGAALEGVLDAGELPGSVARAVTKAAVAFISDQAGVPAAAAVLAEGVLRTMFVTKIQWAMAAAVTVALLGGGAGVATYGVMAGDDPPAKTTDDKKKEPPPKPPAVAGNGKPNATADFAPHTAAGIRKLLDQPAGLDQPLENLPLRDVFSLLSDKFGVTIRIDPAACARFGMEKPFDIYDQPVRLPVVRGLTLGQVLHDVLAQLRNTKENGTVPPLTFKVKGTHIVIVPAYMIPFPRTLRSEGDDVQTLLNPDIVEDQVQGDPVSVDAQGKPLIDVLRELGDATGANIVLDNRVTEKGQTPVSATLQNVRLLTTLRVIADMADLQPTTLGNVYYVTTKENADRLFRQEWLKPAPGTAAKPEPSASHGK
jgi:RNA polymerase sigma factor (sigma-70 family)